MQKITVIPLKSIVRISVERPPLLRIFRAKEVKLRTLRGGVKFYLHKEEPLPFLKNKCSRPLKTGFFEQAFGAFIETRALSGIAVFYAIMRNIGSVFGSDYYNRVLSAALGAIFSAAETVSKTLAFLHIAVPKIATLAAVLAAASWALAYLRNLAKTARLRVGRNGDFVTVSSGVITLYEHTLVRDSASAVTVSSVAALIARRAPLYLRGVMIHPAVARKNYRRTLKTLCGIAPEKAHKASPPAGAFFGYCLTPILWSAVFAVTIALFSLSEYFLYALLIKSALYIGLAVSLYTAFVYLLYFRHSGISLGSGFSTVDARRALRLYTAIIPNETIVQKKLSQSFFQARSKLCNYRLHTVERQKFTARQLPKRIITSL